LSCIHQLAIQSSSDAYLTQIIISTDKIVVKDFAFKKRHILFGYLEGRICPRDDDILVDVRPDWMGTFVIEVFCFD
jgi:hypothetical protein